MDLGRTESSVLPLSQNPGRGMIALFHPQEKKTYKRKRKTGDTKIIPREGNASQNDGNPSLLEYPSLLGDPTSCRRSSKPAPGRHLSTPPPARRVWRWRPFCRHGNRRLLCGADVARSPGRGWSAGARESLCPAGYTKTE